jgi:type I restriction enzyme S subunit
MKLKQSSNGHTAVKLESVITEATSGFACGQRADDGVIQLRMNNVTRRGELDWSSVLRVPSEMTDLESFALRSGDVLFNNTNSTELVGKTVYFDTFKEPVVFSNHFTRLRSDTTKLDPGYLALWLHKKFLDGLFAKICDRWVGQSAVRRSKLLGLEISLPLVTEQRQIATRLREQMAVIERARAAVQAQLDAAQILPSALLRDIFTGHDTQSWPRKKIGEIAQVQSGYAFKSDWFTDKGIRLLRNVNVAPGNTTWDDTAFLPENRRAEFPDYELHEGDIILSLDRPVVSGGLKLARLTKQDLPALLLQRVGRFVLKDGIDANFLHCFLQTAGFIRKITAHDQSLGVPHVSPKQIEEIEFPFPTLAEQKKIAARLDTELTAARTLVETLESRLAEIELLPAALLRSAFSQQN